MRSLGAAPLLMLPVLLWFAVEFYDITPHSEPVTILTDPIAAAGGGALAELDASDAPQLASSPPPPPPPPQTWDYWQKVGCQTLVASFWVCISCGIRPNPQKPRT